ncbi:MAG: DUF2878 domain-containing protein [Planctomycetota bacterium]
MNWRRVANFCFFQAGWFACVLGAAEEIDWVGPVFVATWVAGFTLTSRLRTELLRTLAVAIVIGFLADSLLVKLEVLSFRNEGLELGPTRLWMIALWMNFAATLTSSLSWLLGRPLLSAGLGLATAPVAYLGAESLGAVALSSPSWASALWIGGAWAVALPALAFAAARAEPAPELVAQEGTT